MKSVENSANFIYIIKQSYSFYWTDFHKKYNSSTTLGNIFLYYILPKLIKKYLKYTEIRMSFKERMIAIKLFSQNSC